ncbi:ATP-binding cassette domain-containing protein [Pedobacter nyackensis]|uniref:ATP-binding cassette domain-containing protein n=1 Tax=Pedobacter nyackensis TaxID=475255 RepID=UPI00292E4479|nr:ATP-binding cassette domain-containing protein [Pedobacter nyackensis]
MQELYIDSVAHRYEKEYILNNVYINCKIGEIVGLLGRNGSGKSTLLKIIFGSIQPNYMHMRLNDEQVKRAYITGKVAYLPQHFFIPAHLRVKQLVEIYSNKYKKELFAQDIIRENINRAMEDLSGGQRRLIEFMLVLYGDSDFVLLDEPFTQLAPIVIEEMQRQLFNFRMLKGVILTDHYYQEIIKTASRIVLLHNGCNYRINGVADLQLHGYLSHIVQEYTS